MSPAKKRQKSPPNLAALKELEQDLVTLRELCNSDQILQMGDPVVKVMLRRRDILEQWDFLRNKE